MDAQDISGDCECAVTFCSLLSAVGLPGKSGALGPALHALEHLTLIPSVIAPGDASCVVDFTDNSGPATPTLAVVTHMTHIQIRNQMYTTLLGRWKATIIRTKGTPTQKVKTASQERVF